MIRGPQGSALYGSDAISGVVQVVTRKGRTGSGWTPQFEGALSGGVQESRYIEGTGFTQKHTGRLSLGEPLASLGIGGSVHSAAGVIPDRDIFFGVSLNIKELFFKNSRSKLGRAVASGLNYLQLPYTGVYKY